MTNRIERDAAAVSQVLLGYVGAKPPLSHGLSYTAKYFFFSTFHHVNIPF